MMKKLSKPKLYKPDINIPKVIKRRKAPEERLKEAFANVPKITNETVAEHREEVLSSARKYIYPLQHSRKRIVFMSSSIAALAVFLFLAYILVALYRFQSTSSFIYGVTQVIPFPVAKVGGSWVSYDSYLFELKRYMHYYETQQQVNFLFSILAGVAPFGTLIFELVMAHKYHDNKQVWAISMLIRQNNSLLAAQPSHGVDWKLPVINADLELGLENQIIPKLKEIFSMEPETLHTHVVGTTQVLLEIGFPKTINSQDLSGIANKIPFIDELCFINKKDSPELFGKVEPFRSIDVTA